jgi:hypothetical protein
MLEVATCCAADEVFDGTAELDESYFGGQHQGR